MEKDDAEMTDAHEVGIIDKYLASKMKEVVNVVVQLQTNKLIEEAQAENQDFLNQTSLHNMVMLSYLKEDEMIKTWIKTPLLDQTGGRREGNLACSKIKSSSQGTTMNNSLTRRLPKLTDGDFERLHLQDIEDMLLLLVQQKLTNITIDERNKDGISANEEME
nr:hypothetical protein [Tanacetum cinerariifolium]